jgi:ferredoxin
MADYEYKTIDGETYAVPKDVRPRKKTPPLVVVMNDNCTSCSGSPMCQTECPVDCIHLVLQEERPVRVWVDNDTCIGCMNCVSYEFRPKHVNLGDVEKNCEALNHKDLAEKDGVCPWDAIEILPFEKGVERSKIFYPQPARLVETKSEG